MVKFATNKSPSSLEIIIEGIDAPKPEPAITEITPPETLFIIIAPTAPAFCATRTLDSKVQVPLLIRAIFPVIEPAGKAEQASSVGIVPSFTNSIGALKEVVIVDPKLASLVI